MKRVQCVIFGITLCFVICIWIVIISLESWEDEPLNTGKTVRSVIDLHEENGNDNNIEQLFDISGFEYFPRIPIERITGQQSVLKFATKLWVINNKPNCTGTIVLENVQRFNMNWQEKNTTGPPERADVVVLLTYYISSDQTTHLTVIGINTQSNEQTMEMLDAVTAPAMMCTKFVYLGPVDKVLIEGFAENEEDFVVVDELKIGVGVDHSIMFDEQQDMLCRWGPFMKDVMMPSKIFMRPSFI